MSGDHERAGFEAMAAEGAEDAAARALGAKLKAEPDARDLKAMAALWLHCAAAAPERTPGLFDAAAEGWLGQPVEGPVIQTPGGAPEPIPRAFWDGLWDLTREPRERLETVAPKTAALAGRISPAVLPRVAHAAIAYPEVTKAAARGYPEKFSLDTLRLCPPQSLAGLLYRRVVDEGLDLQPLAPDTLGLETLPPPLGALNARFLQCHHLWRLTAGYQSTALHELAFSGFLLAQFGHHYSSMYLGVALTRVAFERPEGGPILLETILGAWAHGRRTPSLLPVRWESMWDQSVETVRAKLGVSPYASAFPADLFEQTRRPADAA